MLRGLALRYTSIRGLLEHARPRLERATCLDPGSPASPARRRIAIRAQGGSTEPGGGNAGSISLATAAIGATASTTAASWAHESMITSSTRRSRVRRAIRRAEQSYRGARSDHVQLIGTAGTAVALAGVNYPLRLHVFSTTAFWAWPLSSGEHEEGPTEDGKARMELRHAKLAFWPPMPPRNMDEAREVSRALLAGERGPRHRSSRAMHARPRFAARRQSPAEGGRAAGRGSRQQHFFNAAPR